MGISMNWKKNWMKFVALQLVMAGVLGGCGDTENKEENLVIVEQDAAPIDYKLVAVSVDDVKLTQLVTCSYSQLEAQELAFEISGKRVNKVYVKQGDAVKAGQVLAELSGADKKNQIEDLEYRIARNKEVLEQLKKDEEDNISSMWLDALVSETTNHYLRGWAPGDNREAVKNRVDALQKNNSYTITELEDSIALDEKELGLIKREAAQSVLKAKKDGTVSEIKNRLAGSTSVKDEVVIEILDSSECMFLIKDMSLASYVKEDTELEMAIRSGNAAGDYVLVPYDMDNWKDAMTFVISQGGDNVVIEAGTTGYISFVLDERKQVKTLPSTAVHNSDNGYYVYIVGDDGVRQVKWIDVGLVGNDKAEILGGLDDGEKVVLR